MKKPDEIKKSMEHCEGSGSCIECAYNGRIYPYCIMWQRADALDYIHQLESTIGQINKALCGKENATLDEVLRAVSQVKADLEAVKRERDAAVRDCARFPCYTCAERENGDFCPQCRTTGTFRTLHEWRGVCPENTEVQDGH